MSHTLEALESHTGLEFFGHQREAILKAEANQGMSQRMCLFYKTGAGKTYTALACIKVWGYDESVVIAPPSTHSAWEEAGAKLGVVVQCMSHAKFRMKDTKLSRGAAVIADEFHLFGGHKGKGWKKFDTLARGLVGPIVLASATPNYNDAERVYCIQHVLAPHTCKGGYIEFLYKHCTTEQNPFGMEPIVTGFHQYEGSAEYLADLPEVEYLADDIEYTIVDITYPVTVDQAYEDFGFDARRRRIIASQMEDRHTRVFQGLVSESGFLHEHVYEELIELSGVAPTPLLIYANHATVAVALSDTLTEAGVCHGLVTGDTSKKDKEATIQAFKAGAHEVLVGTASLATGTDGMDKVCDWLVILDDTDDDSLRRQLVGRIMPRGLDTDAAKKQIYRLTPVPFL